METNLNEKFLAEALEQAKQKQADFERKLEWFRVQLGQETYFIGKCSGSHTFGRDFKNRQNIYAHAIRIDDAFISKDECIFDEVHKEKNKITLEELTPENIDTAKIMIQYTSISIYNVERGGKMEKRVETGTFFKKPGHLPITRVRIDPKVFEELLSSIEGAVAGVIKKETRTSMAKEYSYESHYREDNSSRIDTLRKLGYVLVRIPDTMQLGRVIDWHPFVYRDHIVLSEESVQLVRDKYKEECERNSFDRTFIQSYGERFSPTSAESDYASLLGFLESELKRVNGNSI